MLVLLHFTQIFRVATSCLQNALKALRCFRGTQILDAAEAACFHQNVDDLPLTELRRLSDCAEMGEKDFRAPFFSSVHCSYRLMEVG